MIFLKKALIAMSGGVDSSVAAKIIKDAGYDCMGATMKLFNKDDIIIDCDKAVAHHQTLKMREVLHNLLELIMKYTILREILKKK